jgi:DNA modification methylase
MKKNIPRSTKLNSKENKSVFYKYYAGFSDFFVEDMINILKLNNNAIILDPWNGSGTTTYVATLKGYKSIGLDLNPVMSIVAKARLVNNVDNEIFIEKILKESRKFRKKVRKSDNLCGWFSEGTVKVIRNLERAIFNGEFLGEVLVKEKIPSNTQAFYCLALFNLVKSLATSYKTSNPTWIKKPSNKEKIDFSRMEIEEVFKRELKILIEKSKTRTEILKKEPKIMVGNSECIPLKNQSIDAVITSPPYCTRIDYAIMTSLELAILGINNSEFNQLRQSLIGAPVIFKNQPEIIKNWGEMCIDVLRDIKHHHSKASNTYYFKTYLQYFAGIFQSLNEINRVLKNNGYCVLVVQNSYYKNILVNLKGIIIEMAMSLGWELVECFEFINANNLAEINIKGKEYRGSSKTTEVAIVLKKGEI